MKKIVDNSKKFFYRNEKNFSLLSLVCDYYFTETMPGISW